MEVDIPKIYQQLNQLYQVLVTPHPRQKFNCLDDEEITQLWVRDLWNLRIRELIKHLQSTGDQIKVFSSYSTFGASFEKTIDWDKFLYIRIFFFQATSKTVIYRRETSSYGRLYCYELDVLDLVLSNSDELADILLGRRLAHSLLLKRELYLIEQIFPDDGNDDDLISAIKTILCLETDLSANKSTESTIVDPKYFLYPDCSLKVIEKVNLK